ncbi:MAG: hypothetical protein EA402_13995 [Planctomycetota bacterium]|nr:MAG: hypothetical protein EA402_13995 [Planctomycetota bacterium]
MLCLSRIPPPVHAPSRVLGWLIPAIALTCLLALPLAALESDAASDEQLKLRLGTPHSQVQAGQEIPLILRFRLQDSWHLYWHNPGDSGMPPQVRADLPDGVSLSDWELPPPQHLIHAGLGTFALKGEVLLLATLRVSEDYAESVLPLRLRLDWLVCDDQICLPGEAELALSIPVSNGRGDDSNAEWQELVKRAALQRPQDMPNGLQAQGTPGTDQNHLAFLSFPAELLAEGESAWVVPSQRGWLAAGQRQQVTRDNEQARIDIPRSRRPLPEQLQGLLIISAADGSPLRAYHLDLPFSPKTDAGE